MEIENRKWGCINGKEVFLFDLCLNATRLTVSNYGGIIQAWVVRRANGNTADLVLGYDTLEEYKQSNTYFGATVGPIADRIADGRCHLADKEVVLPQNAGPDCSHSEPYGFQTAVFDWKIQHDGLLLYKTFAEEKRGFPGNLTVEILFRVLPESGIRITYSAHCDKETALSITNHSYFSLTDGEASSGLNQILTVHSNTVAGTTRDFDPICTEERIPVHQTCFDLRKGQTLQNILSRTDCREIKTGNGLDHYFFVDGNGMREMAHLESLDRSEKLICRSDAPGLLVYAANGLDGEYGKNGKIYQQHAGVCLETESIPNAVNMPAYRENVILPPETPYRSVTEYIYCAIPHK